MCAVVLYVGAAHWYWCGEPFMICALCIWKDILGVLYHVTSNWIFEHISGSNNIEMSLLCIILGRLVESEMQTCL